MEDIKLTMEGLGPWSFSKLKSLKNCPFQFYLKYVYKLKGTLEKSPEALVGSAAHKILELFIVGKSLDSSIKETKTEFHVQMGDTLWQQVLALESSITDFKVKLDDFSKQNPIKRVFAEMKIGVTREFTPSQFFAKDVFFRGIVDLALLLENGDAIFIDHKKGGKAAYGLKNYTSQLDSQKVLFHGGVMEIEGATAGIHFIEAGEIRLGDHHTKEEIETTLRNDLIYSIDNSVHRVLEIGYFKHIAGNACKWCEYAGPCKSGELKEIENNTRQLVNSCLKQ